MLQIAVVENDAPTRETLCRWIEEYAKDKGNDLAVTPLENDASLRDGALTGYDIIFLDIMLPERTHMDLARQLRTADPDVVLVFITHAEQYASQGYTMGALDFLVKPVEPCDFLAKLERALARAAQRSQRCIALKTAGGVQVLSASEILYVETHNRKPFYHTTRGSFAVRGSMQSAEALLGPLCFVRCNQCYLINLRHVNSVQNDFVTVGRDRLAISRRQRAVFLEATLRYVGD